MNRIKSDLERNQTLLFVVLVVTSLGLMTWNLGGNSLSYDEGWTYYISSQGWGTILEELRIAGVHPPLHFILVKLVGISIGWSEATLRIISLVSVGVSLFLSWKLGNLVGGKAGGFAALWLSGFHPMILIHSRIARPYGLLYLLTLATVYLFVKFVQSEKRGDWILIGLLLMLGSLTHFFSLLLGAFMFVYSFLQIRDKPTLFRKTFLIWGIFIIPLIGWVSWFLNQDDPGIAITWIVQPDVKAIFQLGWALVGGGRGSGIAIILFPVISIILIAFGLFKSNQRKFTWIVLVSGLIIPIAVIWLISQKRPMYVDRYFIVLLPFIVILVASGANDLYGLIKKQITNLDRMHYFLGAIIIITALISGIQIHVKDKYQSVDWRGATEFWEERWNGKDMLWVNDGGVLAPMSFYFEVDIFDIDLVYELEDCTSHCWRLIEGSLENDEVKTWEMKDCQIVDEWISPTGIAIWKLQCGDL